MSNSRCCTVLFLFAATLLTACGGISIHQESGSRPKQGGDAPSTEEPDQLVPETPGDTYDPWYPVPIPNPPETAEPNLPETSDPSEPTQPTQPTAPVEPPPANDPGFDYAASLTADFAYRDSLPQTTVPESEWFAKSAYGPAAATYPEVTVPEGVGDPLQWARDRVIEVGKHFLGVPYANLHIPDAGGLDCSNFTAWVYNYGFGIRFTSNTQKQAVEAGRKLNPGEPLQKGDLMFIWNSSRTEIGHAAIYIDAEHIIDSTSSASPDGVGLRAYKGWYKDRFAYARRILE